MSRHRIVAMLAAVAVAPAVPVAGQEAPGAYPGDALRARLGATVPRAATMVVAYAVAQHHTRFETSVVAVRGADGRWTIERAVEESAGLLAIEPKAHPVERSTLSPADGRTLDRLLAGRAISTGRVTGGKPSIGGAHWQMAIVTPALTRRIAWDGRLTGMFGKVADIVVGRG